MKFKELESEVLKISREVGDLIRDSRKKLEKGQVREKRAHDLVTTVDEAAERLFVERLSALLPEAGFITEEGTRSERGAEYDWVIDPLDGTTNFVHGIPSYCTSVALLQNENPVLGVIHEIVHEESFHASIGSPAMKDGESIQVSDAASLDDSLLVTGFPPRDFEGLDAYIEVFKELLTKTRGMRRLGSAAADLAYVACGRFELFYEFGLNPWDVAAGILIVQQAGGQVSDFSLGNEMLFGKEIIASNGKTHQEFHELFKKSFPLG